MTYKLYRKEVKVMPSDVIVKWINAQGEVHCEVIGPNDSEHCDASERFEVARRLSETWN